MAKIREYEAPSLGLNPGDMGASDAAAVGQSAERTANSIGNAIGGPVSKFGGVLDQMKAQADKAKSQKEIIQGIAGLSTIENNLSDEWDDISRNTDPNNLDQARSAFLEKANGQLSDFSSSFETDAGQMWAAEHTSSVADSFFKNTTADTANAAAYATKENINQAAGAQSQTVYNSPSSLDDKLGQVDSSVDAVIQSSNVSSTQAAQAKSEMSGTWKKNLVNAAIDGAINKDPVQAAQDLALGKYDKYAQYIGEDGIAAAIKQAGEAVKTAKVATDADATAKTKADTLAANQAVVQLYSQQVGPDGKFTPTGGFVTQLNQIAKQYPDAISPSDYNSALDFVQKAQKGDTATINDPTTFKKLQDDLASGNLNAPEIWQAAVDGKLKPGEDGVGLFMGALSANSKMPHADSIEGQMISNALNQYDYSGPDGAAIDDNATTQYRGWLLSSVLSGLNAGKSVQDMLDPSSKDYLPGKFDYNAAANANTSSGLFGLGGTTGPYNPPLVYPPGIQAPANAVKQTDGSSVVAPNALPPITDDIFNKATAPTLQKSSYVPPAAGTVTQQASAAVNTVSHQTGTNVSAITPAGEHVASLSTEAAKPNASPLSVASRYLGDNEQDNAVTLAGFIKSSAGININPANTAWCAAWMNAVLAASGNSQSSGNRLAASSFSTYGDDVTATPQKGDIAVFSRKGGGHVGFYMGLTDDGKYVQVLGGNQGSRGEVSITLEPVTRLVTVRRIHAPASLGTEA